MGRIKHARHPTRVDSVRAAGTAGTDPLRTYNMRNTNDYLNPTNTVRFKASSSKRQASSPKLQASSSKKLDKSSRVGYCRSQGQARDGQAIDICEGPLMGPRNSAAEILQVEQHKYPGDRSSRNCRVMVPHPATQASKDKRATSKQTNEQAPLATNHEQRTSKQIPRTNKH